MADGGAVQITALELQVKDRAGDAAKGLDALAASLSRIRNALSGNLGLGTVANQLNTFSDKIKRVGTGDTLAGLHKLIKALGDLGKVGKGMERVRDVLNSDLKLGTAANQLRDFSNRIKTIGTGDTVAGIHRMTNAVNDLAKAATSLSQITNNLKGLDQLSRAVGKMNTSAQKGGKTDTAAAVADAVPQLAAMPDNIKEAKQEASKVTENLADSASKAAEAQKNILGIANALKEAKAVGPVQITTDNRPHLAGHNSEQFKDVRDAMNARRAAMLNEKVDRSDFKPASEVLGTSIKDAAPHAEHLKNMMGGAKAETEGAVRASVALAPGMATAASTTEELKTSVGAAASETATLKDRMTQFLEKIQTSSTSLKVLRAGFKSLKDAIFSAHGGLLGFITGMARMARYRLFRSLIRNITEGFTEGLKNLREYSKAVDNLYNKDMTGLENATFKMKNSLGAALGSAIQSLIPLLKQLSQWVINVANSFNQFFAIIGGRTSWTRAVDAVAADFEKTKDNAAGAAKEAKNLLASWDELNIIQSKSGGSGAGSGNNINGDYGELFEEVYTFDERIQELAKWFDKIKDNAAEIGALLLAWKIAPKLLTGLRDVSPIVSAIMGAILGVATAYIAVVLDYKFMSKYLATGDMSDLGAAEIVSVAGAALSGLLVAKGFHSAAAGVIAFGAVLAATGLVDMTLAFGDINDKGITKENATALALSTAKTALGIGTLASGIMGVLSRLGLYKGAFGFRQGAGTFMTAAAVTAGVALDVVLTQGILKEDEVKVEDVLKSMAAKAGTAVLAGLGGLVYGGKDMGFTFAGGALMIQSAVDLTLDMGNIINNGVTQANVISSIKDLLGLSAGAAMVGQGYKPLNNMLTNNGMSAMSLGLLTFSVGASVVLSASLNKEALEEGSLAEVAATAVSDALTSTALGVYVGKMTGDAKKGAGAAGLLLTVEGAVNLAGTLNDIKMNGFDEANTASLVKSALEMAIGTGLAVAMYSGQAWLGFAAGVLTLVVTAVSVALSAEVNSIHATLSEGKIKLDTTEIDAALKNYMKTDVTMTLNVVSTRIAQVVQAKVKARAALQELQGAYTVWVRTGVKKLEGDELTKFCESVGDIVETINGALTDEQSIINLSLGMYTTTEEDGKQVLTNISKGIEMRMDVVQAIGKRIGEILKKGTLEGYEDVVPKMMRMLEVAAGMQERTRIATEFGTAASVARSKFMKGDLTAESFNEYVNSYANAREKAESEVIQQVNQEAENARNNYLYLLDYKEHTEDYNEMGVYYENVDALIEQAKADLARYSPDKIAQIVEKRVDEITGMYEGLFQSDLTNALLQRIWNSKTGAFKEQPYDSAQRGFERFAQTGGAVGVNSGLIDAEAYEQHRLKQREAEYKYYADMFGVQIDVLKSWVNQGLIPELSELTSRANAGRPVMSGSATERDVLKRLAEGNALIQEYRLVDLGNGNYALGYNYDPNMTSLQRHFKEFDERKMFDLGLTFDDLITQMTESGKPILDLIDEWYELGIYHFNFDIPNGGGSWTVPGGGSSGSSSSSSRRVQGMPSTDVTPPGAPGYSEGGDETSANQENQLEQISLMQAMLTMVTQIYNKEFTAKVIPSANLGRVVDESYRLYEKTMG